jgi:hypothetical protein
VCKTGIVTNRFTNVANQIGKIWIGEKNHHKLNRVECIEN